jgi:hypothetical protein
MMQITNKIVLYLHYSYTKLYAQGTPTSAAIVSLDEGIDLMPTVRPSIDDGNAVHSGTALIPSPGNGSLYSQ